MTSLDFCEEILPVDLKINCLRLFELSKTIVPLLFFSLDFQGFKHFINTVIKKNVNFVSGHSCRHHPLLIGM